MARKEKQFPAFRHALAAAMIAKGYVQTNGKPDALAFAHALGTSPANVYRWLGGMHPQTWLGRIAKALDVDERDLLFGTVPEPPANEEVTRSTMEERMATYEAGLAELRAEVEAIKARGRRRTKRIRG